MHDHVIELPIAGALVHAACYERETGARARRSQTLGGYLRAHLSRAA